MNGEMPSSPVGPLEQPHISKAWDYVYQGVPPEQAADLVLPAGDGPINQTNRGIYRFALVTFLSRKKLTFARAMDVSRSGGDWRKAFRGKHNNAPKSAQSRKVGLPQLLVSLPASRMVSSKQDRSEVSYTNTNT